jgi:hypothetical protein
MDFSQRESELKAGAVCRLIDLLKTEIGVIRLPICGIETRRRFHGPSATRRRKLGLRRLKHNLRHSEIFSFGFAPTL